MSDRLQGVRILFVLPSLGLGGAERQAFLLARHLLQRERADVRLLGTTRFSTMTGQCDANGLPYEFFDLQRGYLGGIGHVAEVAQFVAVLRRLRVQILLPYCMFQNILCGLTWRAGGARVCIWNQRDEGRSRLARWVERLAVAQIPRFISNSHHGAQFLTDTLQVPTNRVHVIHNGIEIPPARLNGANWRGQLGVPSDALVACMVANLHRRKDHTTLIAAWRLVVDRLEPTGHAPHLLVAGLAVDTYDQLVEQVHRLGLEGLVHFLGEVRDVPSLLTNVDLAVFSSFAEGVPNAVLEAMAMGRAVVATDYPGIREAVGPAGAPWLARARDAEDLANKIVTAALDPALRDRLGSQGRCRVVNHFSVEKMAAAMTDVILEEWEERSR